MDKSILDVVACETVAEKINLLCELYEAGRVDWGLAQRYGWEYGFDWQTEHYEYMQANELATA